MRRTALPGLLAAGFLVATGLYSGCGGDETTKPTPPRDDGGTWTPPDFGIRDKGTDATDMLPDVLAPDLAPPKDLEEVAGGPLIEFLFPKKNSLLIGDVAKLQVRVTDEDGVDEATVQATPEGQQAILMAPSTSTAGVFEAAVDITNFGDNVRIYVRAADLLGNASEDYIEFQRDPGPRIQIVSPVADSRHKGSALFEIAVTDKRPVVLFEARIGAVVISLTPADLGAGRTVHSGTVNFDDPMFNPALKGEQLLVVTAENDNQARSTLERRFFVDHEGPTITIQSQAPGVLIGGIITLAAEVSDPAGVDPTSVKCVIGNNLDTRTVILKPSSGSTLYRGQFDTRTLSQYDLWPVMSFRAADTLGNENHADIEVGLDNGPPVLALDPPEKYVIAREKDIEVPGAIPDAGIPDGGSPPPPETKTELQCSHPFDPVGSDAASDLDLVPQIARFRARIEDMGNPVKSAPWVPISMVDTTTTKLFFLDDTDQALVVDTTGDGYCDSINPNVIPLGTVPAAGQAVAVGLVPIPPSGAADFTAFGGTFPFSSCKPGDDEDPPDGLCLATAMTIAISWDVDDTQPAIYSIPPVGGGSAFTCTGLPFDFGANSFANGWACAAASAADQLGNGNVSPPLRVWVDKNASSISGSLPAQAGTPPACTGTYDKATGTADASKPCKFRTLTQIFPQVFPDAEIVLPK